MDKQAGYKYLLTYQYSLIICDLTVEFCQKYYFGREFMRQRDQMTQAARSGKQNIVEGYEVESLETYIKLLGVARGSIFELLEDYNDFLRQNNLRIWNKNEPKMRELRDLRVMEYPNPHIPQFPHIPQVPELAGNLLIMFCQRTTYLLDKQIEALKQKFIKEGGMRENLFKQRVAYRRRNDWS
ncbi:MAG: four helix bundle suffix domain-containing protein [bacterium]|nr:four helix bundle suffix domain-containing protein [bacterium]